MGVNVGIEKRLSTVIGHKGMGEVRNQHSSQRKLSLRGQTTFFWLRIKEIPADQIEATMLEMEDEAARR